MERFAGRVAVVTGAASGIGFALAARFAQEGMRVVLADIEAAPLAAAAAAIQGQGGTALAVRTDVMHEEQIRRLADAAFEAYGAVHVLCNNAGVSCGAADGLWNVPMQDWHWVMGVDFWSVLHAVRHFVPRMLAGGDEGHVVNTASVAGLLTGMTAAPYTIAKHAVVALSELLYKDFKAREAKLSASVLCPGWVNTKIMDSARNRPQELPPAPGAVVPGAEVRMERVRELLRTGIDPADVAGQVFEAIRSDRFYVVPAQPYIEETVALRLEDIRLRRNPSPAPAGASPPAAERR